MRKESKTAFALLALLLVPLFVWGQKNIPMVLENESVRQSGPRSPFPPPTVVLDGTTLTFDFATATAAQVIIVNPSSDQTVYTHAFGSSTHLSIDVSQVCVPEVHYRIRLKAHELWWWGEFDAEKKKPVGDDESWWYNWNGRKDIELVNDDGLRNDSLQCFLSVSDIIYIGHVNPQYYRYLANLMRQDSTLTIAKLDTTTVVVTRAETNDTVFMRGYRKCDDPELQLNYLGFTNGDYKLNVQWRDCWWRGDFTFKSHWPDGEYVFVDSAYYRLYDRYAATIDPAYLDKPGTLRRGWDWCKPTYRDYPDHLVIPEELIYEGKAYEVVAIEKRSFWHCYYLLSVKLPNTVTHIDNAAFMDCPNLRCINIPPSVTSLGDGAFSGCERLSDIVIPEGITVIKGSTFEECTNIQAITLPSGLTNIGERAFAQCTSLPYMEIPDNVKTIEEEAFFRCYNLMEIKLPKSLKSIKYRTFYFCSSLASIVIPQHVRSIGDEAFAACTKLASVTLPESLTQIGDKAFADMPNSGHIYCEAKNPCRISENTFNFKCTLHVPYGCKKNYEKDEDWKKFTNIEEMEAEEYSEPVQYGETGVAPAVSDAAASDGQLYDLQGRPADGTKKGIYIRNGKKVLVR
ncbi:MAG: leucine-rich repeat domain-containing protein [Bacteroidaceae bacterium]|nr:leucine-rich repeat domain-containing protein [Bacteroidaceae bacterium]